MGRYNAFYYVLIGVRFLIKRHARSRVSHGKKKERSRVTTAVPPGIIIKNHSGYCVQLRVA
jgi:hypothetical protein